MMMQMKDALLMLIVAAQFVVGRRFQPELRYQVTEEEKKGTYLGTIRSDANLETWYDDDVIGLLSYEFLRKNQDLFSIDTSTGVIQTLKKLDRDSLCPRQEVCEVRIDVAIQPVEYMEIIKITVEIMDTNDNAPTFPEGKIVHEMRESALVGRSSFVIPAASDPDSPQNSIQEYLLQGGDGVFDLAVEQKYDGSVQLRIVLKEPLDREERERYDMQIVATDGGSPTKSGTLVIHVIVLDTNDNSPEFNKTLYDVHIDENSPLDTVVVRVHADDQDHGLNGKVIYSLSSHSQLVHGHLFGIHEESGEIYVKGIIDYEKSPVLNLAVVALDQGPDSIPADAAIVVHVRDVNDHAPEISVNTLSSPHPGSAAVAEDSPNGTFVAHITVQDLDSGLNALFNCTLNDSHFELKNLYEGEYQVLTSLPLDREEKAAYSLQLTCRDRGHDPQSSSATVPIAVLDVNDQPPVFSQASYRAEIFEKNYLGAVILRVNATDKDIGDNARIIYKVMGTASQYFQIDSMTGDLKARRSLDREEIEVHNFEVQAHDHGNPPLFSSATIKVIVLDVNDETPKFAHSSYSLGVDENEPVGSEVGVVTAEDRDGAPYNEFTYSILPTHTSTDTFSIDRHTGRITNTKILDREAQSVYYLLISASDRGVPPLSSTASVSIFVADRNDNPPVFDYPKRNNNTLFISNQLGHGSLVTRIRAFDLDLAGNAKLNYEMTCDENEDFFKLDSQLGSVVVNRDLSFIDSQVFHFEINVTDGGSPPLSASSNLTIVVNKSITLPHSSSDGVVLSGQNLIIVISLASVSGAIATVLIVVIVIIRHQGRNKPTAKYNCRMEALKMLSAKEAMKEREISEDGVYAQTLTQLNGMHSPKESWQQSRTEIVYAHELPSH